MRKLKNLIIGNNCYTLSVKEKRVIRKEWPKEVENSWNAVWKFYHTEAFPATAEHTWKRGNEIYVDGKWVKRDNDLYVVRIKNFLNKDQNPWDEFAKYEEGKIDIETLESIYYLTPYEKNDLQTEIFYLPEDEKQFPNLVLMSDKLWKSNIKFLVENLLKEKLIINEEIKKILCNEFNRIKDRCDLSSK